MWLDYEGQLDRVWSQPMIINFGTGSKLNGGSHVPDFLAQDDGGDYSLWDVRPLAQVTEHAKIQFEETAKVCKSLGWRYRVLTGHHARATKNLNCIASSRHDRCKPPSAIEDLILAAATNGSSRSALCAIASPEFPPIAAAWVDNLAWRRLLTLNLSAPLRSDTVYTTATTRREAIDA